MAGITLPQSSHTRLEQWLEITLDLLIAIAGEASPSTEMPRVGRRDLAGSGTARRLAGQRG